VTTLAGSERSASFFETGADFRAWLADNHASATELWVGFWKKGSGRRGLGYQASVEEALCFGWIDGLTRRIDEHSYAIRFTPRRPRSNWSAPNIARVEELTRQGRMHPAGVRAFEAREVI